MEASPPRQRDADPSDVGSQSGPCASLLDMVSVALRELGSRTIRGGERSGEAISAALDDEEFRKRAMRWRPTNENKKTVSTLAKLTDAVLSLKPSIKEKFAESGVRNEGAASSESQRLPPVVDPLPFSGSDEARLRKPSSASSMVWSLMMRMVAKRWVTLLVVLVCLLFPRLVAVVIVAFLRLVLRLLFIIFSRLLAEVWSEVQHLMVQVVLASNSFEDYLISSLEGLDRPHWHVPVPQPVPTTPAPQTSLVGGAHGGAPFPPWAPPWLPLSIFALAAALLRRPAGPGGVG